MEYRRDKDWTETLAATNIATTMNTELKNIIPNYAFKWKQFTNSSAPNKIENYSLFLTEVELVVPTQALEEMV